MRTVTGMKRQATKFLRSVLSVLLIAATPWIGSQPSVAQPRAEVPDEQYVRGIVNDWSKRAGVFLDSRFLYEIFSQVERFCNQGNDLCKKAYTSKQLENVIHDTLDDASSGKLVFTSAAQQFVQFAINKGAKGPKPTGGIYNRYVVVDLRALYAYGERISYIHWNGPERVLSSASKALLAVGVHSFAVHREGSGWQEVGVWVRRDNAGKSITEYSIRSRGMRSTFAFLPLRLESDFGRFCLAKSIDESEPLYQRRQPRPDPARSSGVRSEPELTDFARAEIVRVNIQGEADNCNDSCRARIGAQFVQALSQWRPGCIRCLSSTLSVVEVGTARYVASRYVEGASFNSLVPKALPPETPYHPMRLGEFSQLDTLTGFQRLDDDAKELGICQPNQSATTPSPGPLRTDTDFFAGGVAILTLMILLIVLSQSRNSARS